MSGDQARRSPAPPGALSRLYRQAGGAWPAHGVNHSACAPRVRARLGSTGRLPVGHGHASRGGGTPTLIAEKAAP